MNRYWTSAAAASALLLSSSHSVLAQSGGNGGMGNGREPEPVGGEAPAPTNWSGFYGGINVDGSFPSSTATDLTPEDFAFVPGNSFRPGRAPAGFIPGNTNTLHSSGFGGGVDAGYNFEFAQIVLGVEGGFDATGGSNASFNYRGASHTSDLSSSFDALGRVGWDFGRFLPYATGGAVFGRLKNDLSDSQAPFSAGRSSSATGWAVGGGLEYAIDPHWSVKAEYLHMQFPDSNVTTTNNFGYSFDFKFRNSAQTARIGLNFHF
jgi:outer membrane immunogenic protein